MKEERKHSIDKLFQESLGGHKVDPSASIWTSLSGHIPATSGRGILMFLVAAIFIGAFSILINSELSSEYQIADATEDDISMPNTEPEQSLNQHQAETLPVQPEEPASEHLSTDDIIAQDQAYSPPTPAASAQTPADPDENSTITAVPPVEAQIKESPDETSIIHDRLVLLDYRVAYIHLDEDLDLKMDEVRKSGEPVFDLSIKDGYVKKADILFGAGFSPAVNIYPDGQNRNDYSLELIAAYEKSRFIVEGGIGGNYTTESAKYGIGYVSFDSIGYYINVSSFNIDPFNPDSIRFETSMKSVYDSVEHYSIKENTNKYAYLQIPLRVGYRVLQKDRFSLDLKVGVLFSLQVYKDVPEVPYEGNDVDQIEVVRYSPDRLKTNWQYTAGVGMNYHISKNLRFTLEPFYRQYIKSVYSSGSDYSASSPYAFGLRGGIYFHF